MGTKIMKNPLLLIIALFIISCEKTDTTFNLNQQQLVGREYGISYSTIKFISVDSLEWRIERLANKPYITSYRLKYDLNGNSIQLSSKDTLRVDYSESYYDVIYYNDSFDGTFVNNSTISGKISASYTIYKNNMFWSGDGSSTADVTFKEVKRK